MLSSSTQHVRRTLLKDGAFLAINKPTGYTSHDVVDRVRRILNVFVGQKTKGRKFKVGHLGTLDPEASGVLPIAVGHATSYIQYITNDKQATKMYETTIQFGRSTTTDDAQGEIIREVDLSWMEREHVEEHMKYFEGDSVMQRPPMVSAKHINGERAHKLAREGRLDPSLILPVPVRIDELVLKQFRAGKFPEADIKVTCGGGMFVRSLARDLGHKLFLNSVLPEDAAWDATWDATWEYSNTTSFIPGCGSLLTLDRTLSCGFHQDDTIEMDDLETIIGSAHSEDEERRRQGGGGGVGGGGEGAEEEEEGGESKSEVEHQLMNLLTTKFRTVQDSLVHLESTSINFRDAEQRRFVLRMWRQSFWLSVDGNVELGGSTWSLVVASANLTVVTLDGMFAGVATLSRCRKYMKRKTATPTILNMSEEEEKRRRYA
jgi:tRNA pseudouridine(55) synthase